MLHRAGVTANLARFVAETRWEEVPEPARHAAKRALMNFFAVALAGCRGEPVEIALTSLLEFSGRGQATIIGRNERMDALSAAFLNAASANVFDFCDTHPRTVIHPTAPVAPALFALAEVRRVTGPELLLAFILGVEVECRIGNALSPGHYSEGWHITSTCGVFGAAAGAGKLLGLDARKMVWALGNASTQSSGLCERLGTPAKSIGVGNAARNGLWSALLADKGVEGPAEPIAGVQGFLNAMGAADRLVEFTEGLGDTWEVMQNSNKPYPCGFVIHPVLDCVLDWRRAHPGQTVERVVVRGNPLLSDRTDRPKISTGGESQVSVQHAVAAALRSRQGGARAVHRRVRSRDAAGAGAARGDRGAARSIIYDRCGGGRPVDRGRPPHRLSQTAARGERGKSGERPRLEEKLRAIATRGARDTDARPLIDAVWSLDRSDDVFKARGDDGTAPLRITSAASRAICRRRCSIPWRRWCCRCRDWRGEALLDDGEKFFLSSVPSLSGSASVNSFPVTRLVFLSVQRAVMVLVEFVEHSRGRVLSCSARSTVPSLSGSSPFRSFCATKLARRR